MNDCPLQEEKEMRTSGWLLEVEFSPASPHCTILSICAIVPDFLVIHGKA